MSHRPFVAALCLTAMLWASIRTAKPALAADDKAPDLPLKKVVLFSSGVGFYERRGDVTDNAKIELRFNVRDINDLLKSMVLQDLGGGQISTVTYGSKDPITKTLQSFAIDLTSNPTLGQLLQQVRGERIEIDAPDAVSGIIVGVEKRKEPVGKDESVEVEYLNLLTDKGLRSVSLQTVGRIKLANEKLDAELRQALTVLATGHSTDKKSVTLEFLGKGKRPVRVGYIQESPLWKTSYRLVLRDKEAPLLQGWAIVENTTDADWNDVNLTLVSGRPISFVMDLYQPLYVPRPVVVPELFASLRPQTYDQDLAERERLFDRKAAGAPGAPPAAKSLARNAAPSRDEARLAGMGLRHAERADQLVRTGIAAGEEADKADAAFDPGRGVQSAAQASDLGEMFQYTIATPVTLPRQRSAMLPIVNESVQGEKVSIYNPQVHAKHPLAGLKLKNSTQLHLLQGPITVFDAGAYAGDARIPDVQPGSERLVSYAVDLATEVAAETKHAPQNLVSIRLLKGLLHTTHKQTRATAYTVKNSGEKAKKVLVEYPHDPNWNLVAPKEPAEKTRNLYRFAVDAAPGKPAKLDVQEERTINQQMALSNLPSATYMIYINAPQVSDAAKTALQEALRRKRAISALAAQRAEIERRMNVIRTEQGRLRENLKTIPSNSDLARSYIKKFGDQESEVEKLEGQLTETIAQETRFKKEFEDYLSALDIS